ncbi:MAG: cytochrome b/b6 domain-containing protein [Bryobacteraceae bacterium]|nr:cytochrome b/b6 domain-containing protein [Bryobacteraceae bacterium]
MAAPAPAPHVPSHPALVRITHWITALCFFALLLSGIQIVISHPRFYWGETGNSLTQPLFSIPIPASRAHVPTGYGYVLPDQNGWSRSLHFQSAWFTLFAGFLYVGYALLAGHLRRLLPSPNDLSPQSLATALRHHLRLRVAHQPGYNVLQRLAYLAVIFVLFPLMIWTGLAMSPGIVSVFPWLATAWGGHQSVRTIHFFASLSLVAFLFVHVAMVVIAGFKTRMRAMLTGDPS